MKGLYSKSPKAAAEYLNTYRSRLPRHLRARGRHRLLIGGAGVLFAFFAHE